MSELAPEMLNVTSPREFVTSLVNASQTPITNKIMVTYVNRDECPYFLTFDLDTDWVGMLEKVINTKDEPKYKQVIFTVFASRGDGELPHSSQVESVTQFFEDSPLDLLDTLLVDGNRYWSYMCDGGDCCNPQGNEVEIRDNELSEIGVKNSPELDRFTEAEIEAFRADFPLDLSESAEVTWSSLTALPEALNSPLEEAKSLVAHVLIGSQMIPIRDYLMCQIVQSEENEYELIEALIRCVRMATPELQPRIAGLAAMSLRSANGDHEQVRELLDLAEGESLAVLVRRALNCEVPVHVARDSIIAVIETCTQAVAPPNDIQDIA